jgi:SAM-dependent methyltransferase
MKIRDSGMPEEATWTAFFDAERILGELAFDRPDADVVDFGAGYGTFAIAAASLTRGAVYALEIDAGLVGNTAARAETLGLRNVSSIARDFVMDGSGLADASTDYAMLFNILHGEDPVSLLREAWRVLRPAGKVAVMHWIRDPATPRGPPLAIRPSPEQCREWLTRAGFTLVIPEVALPPYHYGIVASKRV